MLTRKRYTYIEMLHWTQQETIIFLAWGAIITFAFQVLEFEFLRMPWLPIGLVGTALAFMIGFQNNSAYGRIWEARKIWGGIVNYSRTWTMMVKNMVTNEQAKSPLSQEELDNHIEALVYRHIAWLNALRHNMRQKKKWEVFDEHRINRKWQKMLMIPEHVKSLEDDLFEYLSSEELDYVLSKGNKTTAIQFLQAKHLKELKEAGYIWEFSFLELMRVQEEFFTLKGKSERIKNFPYPRQYATLGYIFIWLFVIILPFGLIPAFSEIGDTLVEKFPDYSWVGNNFAWFGIPFSVMVSWIFHTMERIGRVGENPFEGSANDVPISNISRAIEIDIRQMLDEDLDMIPSQFAEVLDIQM